MSRGTFAAGPAAGRRGSRWRESDHPRQPAGASGSRGGEFAQKGGLGATDAAWAALGADRFNAPDQQQLHPERYTPSRGFGVHLRAGEREWHTGVNADGLPIIYETEGRRWDQMTLEERQAGRGLPHSDPDGTLVGEVRIADSERPAPYVYRVMSVGEWRQAHQRGYFSSDGRSNLVATEGTVASTRSTGRFYAPLDGSDFRIVRLHLRPEDGWLVDPIDEYVKTRKRIPLSRVSASSPVIRGQL